MMLTDYHVPHEVRYRTNESGGYFQNRRMAWLNSAPRAGWPPGGTPEERHRGNELCAGRPRSLPIALRREGLQYRSSFPDGTPPGGSMTSTITCLQCGGQLGPADRFCAQCGAELLWCAS